jgi:hypothetical protein
MRDASIDSRHTGDTGGAGARTRWSYGIGAALLLALAWWPALDRFAVDTVDAALTRALAAFALARGLNGVISVAQSTELAVQPAGIGVSLEPGQILDPVNDLVEQFSSVMLLAAGSLGLQKLLIEISAWWPLKLALTLALMLWLAQRWRRVGLARSATRSIASLALALLLLRFAVPIAALASEAAYRVFLAPEQAAAEQAIVAAKEGLVSASKALSPPPAPDEGIVSRAQRWIGETAAQFDIDARLADLEQRAEAIARELVDLIVLFVVQTVLLPLAFLWLTLYAARRLTRSSA